MNAHKGDIGFIELWGRLRGSVSTKRVAAAVVQDVSKEDAAILPWSSASSSSALVWWTDPWRDQR